MQSATWAVLVVWVAVLVIVDVGRAITWIPSIADGVEEEREVATFDAFGGSIWVTTTVTPGGNRTWGSVTQLHATECRRLLVPADINSSTPSSAPSGESPGVGVVRPDYKRIFAFRDLGRGILESAGEVTYPFTLRCWVERVD